MWKNIPWFYPVATKSHRWLKIIEAARTQNSLVSDIKAFVFLISKNLSRGEKIRVSTFYRVWIKKLKGFSNRPLRFF